MSADEPTTLELDALATRAISCAAALASALDHIERDRTPVDVYVCGRPDGAFIDALEKVVRQLAGVLRLGAAVSPDRDVDLAHAARVLPWGWTSRTSGPCRCGR